MPKQQRLLVRSTGELHLDFEGFLRSPDSAVQHYIRYPNIFATTETYLPSLREYSFLLQAAEGASYSEDMSERTNVEMIMKDKFIRELKVDNGVARYKFDGLSISSRSKVTL